MDPRPGQGLSPPPREHSEHELRVQLEGAWEVLEQARDRHAALLERLESRRWLRLLREQPESMWRMREHEGALREALEHAEHRLRVEAPPEHHPLRVLLRQLSDQRSQLERFVRKRLARLGERGDRSLMEGLERLETAIFVPLLWPPDKDEPVLFSGGMSRWLLVPAVIFAGFMMGLAIDRQPWWPPLIFVLVLGLNVLFQQNNIRRFWITPRRLVWQSIIGGLEQMPLESIRPEAITRVPGSKAWLYNLRVEGRESVTFAQLGGLDLLEDLLRMHCGRPLRGQLLNPPAYPLMLLPATRRFISASRPDSWIEPGMLVVRTGRIVFLPDQGLDALLHLLFGAWPKGHSMELSMAIVLRQLCLLPATEFDHCLEKVVSPSKGELWAAATLKHGPSPSGYQFTTLRDSVITSQPNASQQAAMGRFLDPASR